MALSAVYQYFIIYKPYGTISQFTREGEHAVLGDLYEFPKDVYPVGRLDTDSEGLLILTNDKRLNGALLDPQHAHKREYWVQVEGEVSPEALRELEQGVEININGKLHQTLPAQAKILAEPLLPERTPPIRFRKSVPTSWLSLTITEGKNHQVRKMTAKVGFPTLRLVRWAIEGINCKGMIAGDVVQMDGVELYRKLKLLVK
ncbi:MAG: pseudouridine synthase [Cytophagales bacterium]|nr:pseudouridine synthase [Cytophagales bacterium]